MRTRSPVLLVAILLGALAGCGGSGDHAASTTDQPHPPAASESPATGTTARPLIPRPGRVPPPLDVHDVYAAGRPNRLSSVVRGDPARIYVPNSKSDSVDVIDQHTFKVIDHFAVGKLPQHVTPSWDLRTLWVTNDSGNSLTPIDPRTGRHGRPVSVADPYNLYFTADGRRAIVVAEAQRRLDFRSPHSMKLLHSLAVPQCAGIDHMDYTADGRRALVSCEFAGRMIVVDLRRERVVGSIDLRTGAMPQDVSSPPTGAPSTWPTWRRMASGSSTRDGCAGWASATPARARTGSTPAATPRRSTSPTGVKARSPPSDSAAAGR